jgi:hypothetical protein
MAKYGERLVCIRYRYDPSHGKRYKTIELIIGEEDWQPPAPHPYAQELRQKAPERFHTRRVGIRIACNESELPNRSRPPAACGIPPNAFGLYRRNTCDAWGWCSESPSGKRYWVLVRLIVVRCQSPFRELPNT